MSHLLAVFLYRVDYDDGAYYGTCRSVDQMTTQQLLGVAVREPQNCIEGSESLSEFRESVVTTAVDVRWFEDSMET